MSIYGMSLTKVTEINPPSLLENMRYNHNLTLLI